MWFTLTLSIFAFTTLFFRYSAHSIFIVNLPIYIELIFWKTFKNMLSHRSDYGGLLLNKGDFLFGDIKATKGEIIVIFFLGRISCTQSAALIGTLRWLKKRLPSEICIVDEWAVIISKTWKYNIWLTSEEWTQNCLFFSDQTESISMSSFFTLTFAPLNDTVITQPLVALARKP
jgi:hypothetical protein